MQRLDEIRARIISKAGNQSGVSTGKMNIPGMKIGTQLAPGAPTFEDIMWLLEKLDKAKALLEIIKTPEADSLISEIRDGK